MFRRRRLFVTGLEASQATQYYGSSSHLTDPADQRPDNSVRLVARKPAWVRVYVAGMDVPPVTGTLEVLRRTPGVYWESIGNFPAEPPGEVTAVANPDYATERSTLGATLNFVIPAELMCGTLKLVARVTAGRWTDTLSVTLPVTLRQTLRIAGVMLTYDGPARKGSTGPNLVIAAPTMADLQGMAHRALTLFPVESTATFRAAGLMTWTKPLDDRPTWDALWVAVANARIADGNKGGWIHVGLLPTGVPGESEIVGIGLSGTAVTSAGLSGTMAHEIGHACGLKHAPAGDPDDPDPKYPTYAPYPPGSIGEYGLDINTGQIFQPMHSRDLMSYGAYKWISPYNHKRLIENAFLNPRTVCVELPWWRDVVWAERPAIQRPVPEPPPFRLELPVFARVLPAIDVISLIIRVEHGTVSAVPHVSRTKVPAHVDGGIATPLTALLRGGDGAILSEGAVLRVPASPDDGGHAGCAEPRRMGYVAQALVPDVARGTSLEITDGKSTLWKRTAPEVPVTITSFDAKMDRRGVLAVAWTTKGEPVEFWIRYSRDGHTWDGIATGLTGREVRLESRCLPSGKGLLQLVAHDGFSSDRSRNVEISLPHRPPQVAILHPRAGFTYVAGDTLRLWATALASDNLPVAAERCAWTLDGSDSGRGTDIWVVAPRAGTHDVSLSVDDGSGELVVTAITFITVSAAGTSRKVAARSTPRTRRPGRKP